MLPLSGSGLCGNTGALTSFGPSLVVHDQFNGDNGEGAVYLTGPRFNIIAGGSVFSGSDQELQTSFDFPFPISAIQANDHTLWLYSNLFPVPELQLTLGGGFDQLRETISSTQILSHTQFDPKIGVSWKVLPSTTLRAAWFETLKRPLIGDFSLRSGQTIEPTQVAGFNQLFDDLPGSSTRRWGVGIDQKLNKPFFESDTLLLGAEWSQRQLTVPFALTDPLTGNPAILEQGWKERYGRGYLSWLPSERLALNAGLDYQALHRTPFGANLDGFSTVQLLQVPFELRYFDPNGLLGLVRTTVVREQGQFLDVTTNQLSPGKGTFATVDMGIGWRYPGRPFIATFEVQNLLDFAFSFSGR